MAKICDVIIGGGGMVGLTLALALAKSGMKVAICDPMPKSTALDAKFDGRVSALAYAAVRMYRALGVCREHLEPDAQPIGRIAQYGWRAGARRPSPFSLSTARRQARRLGTLSRTATSVPACSQWWRRCRTSNG